MTRLVQLTLALLLAAGTACVAQDAPGSSDPSDTRASKHNPEVDLLAQSQDAGLMTDWRLLGPFGKGSEHDLKRSFEPERLVLTRPRFYLSEKGSDLVFASGRFLMPPDHGSKRGVYYAVTTTYLVSSGDWSVWLESGKGARLFVDGVLALESSCEPGQTGLQRKQIHLERGRHTLLVKFLPKAAPFRVAVLPPSGGDRRKNNTPWLLADPKGEQTSASLRKSVFSEPGF